MTGEVCQHGPHGVCAECYQGAAKVEPSKPSREALSVARAVEEKVEEQDGYWIDEIALALDAFAAEARRQENEACEEIATGLHAGAGCLFNADEALAAQHFTRAIIEAIAARREPKP